MPSKTRKGLTSRQRRKKAKIENKHLAAAIGTLPAEEAFDEIVEIVESVEKEVSPDDFDGFVVESDPVVEEEKAFQEPIDFVELEELQIEELNLLVQKNE